jgi:hypothetical protein
MAEKKHWPNGPVIEKLMRAKGFSNAYNFSKAIKDAVSDRSIQLMIRGMKRHKESTLQIIADALGVPLEEITINKPSTEHDNEDNHVEGFEEDGSNRKAGNGATATLIATEEIEVEVEVDESFESRSDESDAAFTEGIRLLLKRAKSVKITRTPRPGSVIYTISLTREEAAELERLCKEHKLGHLKVMKVATLEERDGVPQKASEGGVAVLSTVDLILETSDDPAPDELQRRLEVAIRRLGPTRIKNADIIRVVKLRQENEI